MPSVHHPVNSLGLEWWSIPQFGYQSLGTLLKVNFTHVQLRSSPGVHIGLEVQFSSVTMSFLTLCNPMDCSKPGFPVHHQFLGLTQTHVHWVSDAIQPSHPLSSPSPPAFNLSQHWGLFQWVSSSHQLAKVLEFQLQLQSFQWISGLISFRMDWLDLFAIQGTLKSLVQHHSLKAWIPWCSAFFISQLSHLYVTAGKIIALTSWTFVGKGMSLLFNMLSRLVMGFPGGLEGKTSACNAGDPGSIPGSGRSPGEGNGNPLQYSCLENPMDRGAS